MLRAWKKAFQIVNVTWDPNDIWDDRHVCGIVRPKKAKAQILAEIEHLIKKAAGQSHWAKQQERAEKKKRLDKILTFTWFFVYPGG